MLHLKTQIGIQTLFSTFMIDAFVIKTYFGYLLL